MPATRDEGYDCRHRSDICSVLAEATAICSSRQGYRETSKSSMKERAMSGSRTDVIDKSELSERQ